jgi:hypothetical protein
MDTHDYRREKITSWLVDLFGSEARGKLVFDLAFNTVTNFLRTQALERLLIDSGVIDPKQLEEYVNKTASEFPENFKRIFAELAKMGEE